MLTRAECNLWQLQLWHLPVGHGHRSALLQKLLEAKADLGFFLNIIKSTQD